MKTIQKSEKGQILVLLVLALLGMLGFTALAVDGGMFYADRRYMQSAADASSIAGAGVIGDGIEAQNMTTLEWSCTALNTSITTAYSVTKERALTNDFKISKDSNLGTEGNTNGVKITCSQSGKYADVWVMLTRDTTTSFVHLFTSGPMRNTVSSVTRIEPGLNAGAGYAIVSLSKYCGNNKNVPTAFGGTKLSGTTDVMVITGGIWSNSCIDASGGPDVTITEENKNTIRPNSIFYNTNFPYVPPGSGTVQPDPSATTALHPLTSMTLPSPGKNCKDTSEDSYNSMNNIEGSLAPGNYNNLSFKGPTTLSAGLYCISGTVFMNANASVSGQGITIYYTGTSMVLNGAANNSLLSPNWEPVHKIEAVNGAVEDMLIYVPPEVKADVTINGSSDSYFGGTVYAPTSNIFIAGNATMGHETVAEMALIGYRVDLTGASFFNIKYDANSDYSLPAVLQVKN
jgi:hypothetical protein